MVSSSTEQPGELGLSMEDVMHAASESAALDLAVGKHLPLSPQILCYKITTARNSKTLSLKWLINMPASMEEWSLTKENLQVLEQVVQEQLDVKSTEKTTSPWNSPTFVIEKTSENDEC